MVCGVVVIVSKGLGTRREESRELKENVLIVFAG